MEEHHTKYVFVTGGVVSGLGKGITAASLGRLLKARGYHVTIMKLDPYINVDPGTMSPYQHGEVFVTEDGGENRRTASQLAWDSKLQFITPSIGYGIATYLGLPALVKTSNSGFSWEQIFPMVVP